MCVPRKTLTLIERRQGMARLKVRLCGVQGNTNGDNVLV